MIILTALLWTIGLVLAASDGAWFPFINGIGLVLFGLSTVTLGRIVK